MATGFIGQISVSLFMGDDESRWWRMTAGHNGSLAVDWLEQDRVTVGWAKQIGDFRGQPTEEIVEKSKNAGAGRQVARFLGKTERGDGMSEGDTVIVYAPNPKGMVIGVGEVGEPEYVSNPDLPYEDHRYHRSVTWYDWGTPVAKDELSSDSPQVFTPNTLAEFHKPRSKLENAIKRAPLIPTEEIKSVLSLGSSERDMHLWTMRNLQKLGEGISITEHESPLPVGDVDILAEDSEGWVVIEIKKGKASDWSVGQIKGYMSDLKRETGENVRGILIAEDFSTRVKRAVQDDSVDLHRLKLNPGLESVGSD